MRNHSEKQTPKGGPRRGLKAGEFIPVKEELSFVAKTALIMIISAAVALLLLYFFLDKDIGSSYGAAFKLLSDTYKQLNVYIVVAVLVQLLFSSLVVYFIALLYSHKIAGPMYRLKMVLQQYMMGEEVDQVKFRRSDFITVVSRWFTDFFHAAADREKLIREAEALIAQPPPGPGEESAARRERLTEILGELEGSHEC